MKTNDVEIKVKADTDSFMRSLIESMDPTARRHFRENWEMLLEKAERNVERFSTFLTIMDEVEDGGTGRQ